MAAHAPRNQTSRDIFCMQSFIGIRRWRWPPAMTSDGRIFFGGVLISRNFETPFRFVSFFHFYLSSTNYRRTCLYLLRSLARLYNLHARFFDGIFEIKFCSFGFLSFFSTFIIDIYNARIRPVFKVELLNRQSVSFWTTMYTCILSCTQNKER